MMMIKHDDNREDDDDQEIGCKIMYIWLYILWWFKLDSSRLTYYHILSSITHMSWEHRGLVSIIDVQYMVFANDRIHYGL